MLVNAELIESTHEYVSGNARYSVALERRTLRNDKILQITERRTTRRERKSRYREIPSVVFKLK